MSTVAQQSSLQIICTFWKKGYSRHVSDSFGGTK